NTLLMAGRYAADSLNPGIHGYRHLVRIDSVGNAVENFPAIVCDPDPWSTQTFSIYRADNGYYWLAGYFSGINGHATNYIARLYSDFTVDTTYVSPFLEYDGWVSITTIDSDDNIWIYCASGCNISTSEIED